MANVEVRRTTSGAIEVKVPSRWHPSGNRYTYLHDLRDAQVHCATVLSKAAERQGPFALQHGGRWSPWLAFTGSRDAAAYCRDVLSTALDQEAQATSG